MITKDLCTSTIIILRQDKSLRDHVIWCLASTSGTTGILQEAALRGEEPGREDGGEYLAVGRRRLGVAVAAGRGERDVDAAPVLAA